MKEFTSSITEKNLEDEVEDKGRLGKLFAINTRMLPAKFAYILYGGNLGSHIAFLNVFFTSVGLSSSQAGLITGIRFASATVAQPLWGYISDYTGRRKLVLTILCIGAALPIFSMPWVSKWIYTPSHYSLCSHNSTVSNATRGAFLGNSELLTAMSKCQLKKTHDLNTLFYSLLAIVTFASAFLVPLPGYIDTIAMNVVKTGTEGESYGGQRIFGSIGFSLANLLAGVVADRYRAEDMSNYTAVFYLFLPYTLLLIPVGCYLIGQTNYTFPNETEEKKSDLRIVEPENSDNLSKQVFDLLRSFDVLFFMATVLLLGLANNLFINFAYMLIKDEMKKSKTEMSLVVATATMSETLVFPFTSKIIKMLGGNSPALIIGMFSYAVRFMIMSYDVPFGILVSVQTLHSLGFALSFAAMMEHMHTISPGHINITMNSIMLMLFFSVSSLLANILGGDIYQRFGGKKLFLGKAIVCGLWTLFMLAYYGYKHLRAKYITKDKQFVRYKFSTEDRSEKEGRKGSQTIRGVGIENPISCIDDECNFEVTIMN